VFGALEHIPEPGEVIEHDGWSFEVLEMEGRRIRRVRIRPIAVAQVDSMIEETVE